MTFSRLAEEMDNPVSPKTARYFLEPNVCGYQKVVHVSKKVLDSSDLQIGLQVRDWVRVRVFKLNSCASYNHLSHQSYP